MMPFEIMEPTSLDEAMSLLDPDDPSVRPFAGGTALMLMMKAGVLQPSRLIDLRGVGGGFAGIADDGQGGVRIGAMTPLAVIERDTKVAGHAPVLPRTLRTLSNIRVRNVATLGGHLAHGDPHMDLPPVLIALDATLTIAGAKGKRSIPVGELFVDFFETSLAGDELIAAATVPEQAGRVAAYVKCTTRSADDWPALGVAVSLAVEDGKISGARVAVSAATEMPARLEQAEAALNGEEIGDAVLKRAGDAAADGAAIVGDALGSEAYKRQLLRVSLGRAVRRAVSSDEGNRP